MKAKDLIPQIHKDIRAKSFVLAEIRLKDYFEQVISDKPELIHQFFELRANITQKKHRPCLCNEELLQKHLKRFYSKLKQNLWMLIPEKLVYKPRALPKRTNFKADPEDKNLQDLIKPFVGNVSYQLSMLGVNFDEKGITATNAFMLLFIPKKVSIKGIYCMTSKCFKENLGEAIIKTNYPDYNSVLPTKELSYNTFEIDINEFRVLIKTLENNGLGSKEGLAINFIYGEKEHISFNASKKLLPALQTMEKLGYERAKLWIHATNKALVISPPHTSEAELLNHKTVIILVMPLYKGETIDTFWEDLPIGQLVYDLDRKEFFFNGSNDWTHSIGNQKDDAVKIKIASAKAAAQKQRIRILELEKTLTT